MNISATLLLLLVFQPQSTSLQDIPSEPVPEEQLNTEAIEPMSVEIARSRIRHALDESLPGSESREIFSEVFARCESPSLRSLAAYNLGASLLHLSSPSSADLQDSIGWFQQADVINADIETRSKARYNIGHARYLLAHESQETEQQLTPPGDLNAVRERLVGMIGLLTESAGAFRSVHDINIHNATATENLERVRREIQTLREQVQQIDELMEQQQEQQQQRQQQQQESADKLNELAEQQQQESQENANQQQQQQQQQQDQSQISEETSQQQQSLEQMNQEQQSEGMQQVQEQLQEAREAQQRAQEALENGDLQQAAEEQQRAAESLKNAAEQMQQMADESQQDGEQGQGESQQQGNQQGDADMAENPTEEDQGDEISEIAEMLLDKERQERESRKGYRSTGRPVRVEKDW